MTNENIEKVIEDIDYLKKVVIDSKEIIDFDDYLYYRNEIGSTLQGINEVLGGFIKWE